MAAVSLVIQVSEPPPPPGLIGLKINLDGEKNQPDAKSNKEHKQDVKLIRTKPNIKKEDKLDIEMMKTEPDTNKITYEEENTALILGITSIFTVCWTFK